MNAASRATEAALMWPLSKTLISSPFSADQLGICETDSKAAGIDWFLVEILKTNLTELIFLLLSDVYRRTFYDRDRIRFSLMHGAKMKSGYFFAAILAVNFLIFFEGSAAESSDFSTCFDISGKDVFTTASALDDVKASAQDLATGPKQFAINGDAYVRTTFVCGKAANPKSYESSYRVSYFLPKSSACRRLLTLEDEAGETQEIWRADRDGMNRVFAVRQRERVESISGRNSAVIGLLGLEREPLIKIFDFGRVAKSLSINWETLKIEDSEVAITSYDDNYHRKSDGRPQSYCKLLQ